MATTQATDLRLSVAHQTHFVLRLASDISSNPKYATINAAYSPLSLHVGLSLVAAGAGGATREQLVATLGSTEAGEEAEGHHALAEQVGNAEKEEKNEKNPKYQKHKPFTLP